MASNDPSKSADLPRGLIGRTGTPTGRGTRLPSFKGPRDLTLGGIPKKVFAPKIPVRKDKTKESFKEDSGPKADKPQNQKRDRPDRGRGVGRGRGGRGRGRGQPEVIQSHSIFEQGPSEKLAARSSFSDGGMGPGMSSHGGGGGGGRGGGGGGGGGGRGGGGGGFTGLRPSYSGIKQEPDENKEALDLLLRDDFIEERSSSPEDINLAPVVLPLCKLESCATKEEKKEVKTEVTDEPMETDVTPTTKKSSHAPEMNVKKKQKEISCNELFTENGKSENGELLFFQFPDMMPGVPARVGPGGDNNAAKDDSTGAGLTDALKHCSLRDFSEGYMGKLIVRKSGKTQLLLGSVALDVNMGTPCGFLQDLVSVHSDDQRNQGNITVLGHITHRLICTPDFESLLDET